MMIESNPPGALVYVNNEEVGRTPMQWPFTWYGDYDITLRLKGYETLKTHRMIWPPVWQIAPLDLVTAVLPIPFHDRRRYTYDLASADETRTDPLRLVDRARAMESDLRYGNLNAPSDK